MLEFHKANLVLIKLRKILPPCRIELQTFSLQADALPLSYRGIFVNIFKIISLKQILKQTVQRAISNKENMLVKQFTITIFCTSNIDWKRKSAFHKQNSFNKFKSSLQHSPNQFIQEKHIGWKEVGSIQNRSKRFTHPVSDSREIRQTRKWFWHRSKIIKIYRSNACQAMHKHTMRDFRSK